MGGDVIGGGGTGVVGTLVKVAQGWGKWHWGWWRWHLGWGVMALRGRHSGNVSLESVTPG
ncbi:hypothetical protein SK128_022734 [Halocaridina rubra]|uniref:Uncharacterized protein n=1 Tax=Halocaridina rubra TaxID=373956 RepID=A0AAN8X4W6_HALRR